LIKSSRRAPLTTGFRDSRGGPCLPGATPALAKEAAIARPDRLLELVTLLGGRRPRSLREIVEHFEISERTAYRDLAALDRRKIPLYRDEHGYRLVEGATLRPLNLTAEERALLRLALANPALRVRPALERRLRTLRAKLDAVTCAAEETPQALALAGPERSGDVPDGVMETLERAVDSRRQAAILYASLSGGSRRWRGVDPYLLFHRDGAWYLVGHCRVNVEPRTFRLDRIAEARLTEATFTRPAAFTLESYLESAWSVFRGPKRHEVVLRFSPELAPLVERAHHHPGEELRPLDGGEIEYRVRLSHLDEIARWVVGFGGEVRVVAPEALRGRVREIAEGVVRGIPAPHSCLENGSGHT
jgi:predicted DNA-binding transcriptional regulator YafY